MLFNKPTPLTRSPAKNGAAPIEQVIGVAASALDKLATTAQDLQHQITPLVERAGEQAGALAQRSADAVRERTQQLRDQAQRASDGTLNYIKDEPVKAVLIAAAAGAALVALLGLLRKPT